MHDTRTGNWRQKKWRRFMVPISGTCVMCVSEKWIRLKAVPHLPLYRDDGIRERLNVYDDWCRRRTTWSMGRWWRQEKPLRVTTMFVVVVGVNGHQTEYVHRTWKRDKVAANNLGWNKVRCGRKLVRNNEIRINSIRNWHIATHLVLLLIGGDRFKKNTKALSFQIGSGWNMAGLFFK